MNGRFGKPRCRLPVRFCDGKIELEYGGCIPVADGQIAELIVEENAILDPDLLRNLRKREAIQALPQGTELRVQLAVKEFEGVSKEKQRYLCDWKSWTTDIVPFGIKHWSSGQVRFFPLHLGAATVRQAKDPDQKAGGLWMIIEGRRVKALQSSRFDLPECISDNPATSLNHAFTLLSEAYEPWRISHTGSVYDRIFYKGSGKHWFPLSTLRDYELAQHDQEIALRLWDAFLERMSGAKAQ